MIPIDFTGNCFFQMQKSAVLQKTIDYINYLENFNRRLMEENKQLKTLLKTNGNQGDRERQRERHRET